MDFLELTTNHKPPPNRVGKCDGPHEVHLKECAVMLALAESLFSKGARMVSMLPDGMHLAGFNLNDHLVARGFVHVSSEGRTSVGGRWTRGDDCLRVYPRPGLGDVTSEIGGRLFEFEAKGGMHQFRSCRPAVKVAEGSIRSSWTINGQPNNRTATYRCGPIAQRNGTAWSAVGA